MCIGTLFLIHWQKQKISIRCYHKKAGLLALT